MGAFALPQPLDQCHLACQSPRVAVRCFRGQLGAVYLFAEPLANAVVQAIYSLGPSYDYAFSHQLEDLGPWPYVRPLWAASGPGRH